MEGRLCCAQRLGLPLAEIAKGRGGIQASLEWGVVIRRFLQIHADFCRAGEEELVSLPFMFFMAFMVKKIGVRRAEKVSVPFPYPLPLSGKRSNGRNGDSPSVSSVLSVVDIRPHRR